MGEDSEQALSSLGGVAARAKSGSEQALVARDGAFHLPTLTVTVTVRAVLHLATILGLGPLAPRATLVQSNQRGLHAHQNR